MFFDSSFDNCDTTVGKDLGIHWSILIILKNISATTNWKSQTARIGYRVVLHSHNRMFPILIAIVISKTTTTCKFVWKLVINIFSKSMYYPLLHKLQNEYTYIAMYPSGIVPKNQFHTNSYPPWHLPQTGLFECKK